MKSKKFYGQTKSVDDDNKIITFLGTSTAVDRQGDVVVPEGGELENFRSNPCCLFAHDWIGDRPPIGKSIEERVYPDKGIEFDVQFDFESGDEFPKQIYNKYKHGYMNAVSIGFSPIEWEKIRHDNGRKGKKFTKRVGFYDLNKKKL